MRRYEQLDKLIKFAQPKTIVEIGTHNGKRAEQMCRAALKYNEHVHYIGYDLFDEANDQTNAEEMNGKGAGSEAEARKRLEALGVTFDLIKGNTKDTLHGKDVRADFVFIDGGHSVKTIRGDYEALKASRVIAFDDYYTEKYDTAKFGCNSILAGVVHEVLPEIDRGIRLAVVGYSSKWVDAFHRIRKNDGIKTFSLWRGGDVQKAEMVAAINTLEPLIDVDSALAQIKSLIQKRFFFVLKADAIRSLDWWKAKLETYFQLTEWFPSDKSEVVGTGLPLMLVGEWKSKGVMPDDQRYEHSKSSVAKISKRVVQEEPHERRAIIVCYGTSLLETWPNINGEKKFFGGDVFSVSGSHDFLVRRGIIPDYHIECDPRPHKALNLTTPQKETEYQIASCCHPDLVAKLEGHNVSLWHLLNGQESYRVLDELDPQGFMVAGGGSAGLRAISLAYVRGYRNFSIYGMDCSMADDGREWAGRHAGKKKATIKVKCGDRWFTTSAVLVTYARHFFDTVQRAPDAKFTVSGDGLLQEMCKRMVSEIATEHPAEKVA